MLNFARQHLYYSGSSPIEIRNGADQVITQYVWSNLASPGNYIDELRGGPQISDRRLA